MFWCKNPFFGFNHISKLTMGERGFSLRGKGIVEVDHKDQMYEERQNTQTKSTVISRISKWAIDHDKRKRLFWWDKWEHIKRGGWGWKLTIKFRRMRRGRKLVNKINCDQPYQQGAQLYEESKGLESDMKSSAIKKLARNQTWDSRGGGSGMPLLGKFGKDQEIEANTKRDYSRWYFGIYHFHMLLCRFSPALMIN